VSQSPRNSSQSPGAIITTVNGDLIYEWGASISTNSGDGGGFNGTSITPGSGFTLLSADLQVGSCDEYEVQQSFGSISPSFTSSPSSTWGSLAIALKPAHAGTAPSSTGIRIVHIQHTLIGSLSTEGSAPPLPLQFPSSGNLLVGMFENNVVASSVTDSANNTWNLPSSLVASNSNNPSWYFSQIMYAPNANTSPNLGGITLALQGGAQASQAFLTLYDIAGADPSPFDVGAVASGDNMVNGNFPTVTITPSNPGELVLSNTAIDFNTINGVLAPAILDSVVNTQDDDIPGGQGTSNSSLDEDNGRAHVYNVNTNPITFTFTMNETYSGSNFPGAENWVTAAAAFKPSANPTPTPTPPPSPTPIPPVP